MLPIQRPRLQLSFRLPPCGPNRARALPRALPRALLCASALALGFAANPAHAAQALDALPSVTNPPPRQQFDMDKLDFSANEVEYQDDTNLVTASGDVFLRRGEQTVHADHVRWNRKTGQIIAEGHLRVVDAAGNELITEQMELSDDLSIALTHNMLMLMREGGRLAANEGRRDADGSFVLTKAAYTGCDVVDETGCPKNPSWRVTARSVVYDPATKLVRFKGARLALFGFSIIPLPELKLATDGRAMPGFMIPDMRQSASNGFEFSTTYYMRLSENRDLALTAYGFTKVQPMARVNYRELTSLGAYQIDGYLTRGAATSLSGTAGHEQWRGYLEAHGKFQLDPNWSLDFSGRIASDRTFLLRYYINSDDTLRSTVNLERIGARSYFSLSGWAFQTLRSTETQGLVPIALPLIDYRLRLDDPVLGGRIAIQANSLAVTRSAGQDTQRAFVSAEWSARKLTDLGQIFTLTTLARGDVYHSNNNQLTTTAIYRGESGWQGRAVALAAVDMTWPLVGAALGGTQVLTPHVQIVAVPSIRNMAIPNEDARAIELEDTNIFALNRFPGYDRIEDGTRITYGLEWQLERPRWRVNANVGQSYRLNSKTGLLPDGTGLSGRESDIVGRTEIRYRDFLKITHRYRLDHGDLVFRRNEIDATIGSDATYFEAGYARINRNISSTLEDLQDSNELRAAGRVAFARYWSVFGSGIFDLSNSGTFTGTSTTTGTRSFQPLRTRLGVSFQSDCFQFDVTWRHDYVTVGDAVRGSSFELRFALRNLGFR